MEVWYKRKKKMLLLLLSTRGNLNERTSSLLYLYPSLLDNNTQSLFFFSWIKWHKNGWCAASRVQSNVFNATKYVEIYR